LRDEGERSDSHLSDPRKLPLPLSLLPKLAAYPPAPYLSLIAPLITLWLLSWAKMPSASIGASLASKRLEGLKTVLRMMVHTAAMRAIDEATTMITISVGLAMPPLELLEESDADEAEDEAEDEVPLEVPDETPLDAEAEAPDDGNEDEGAGLVLALGVVRATLVCVVCDVVGEGVELTTVTEVAACVVVVDEESVSTMLEVGTEPDVEGVVSTTGAEEGAVTAAAEVVVTAAGVSGL
jgi:hypothetical protein